MYGRHYVLALINAKSCYEFVSIPLSDAGPCPPQLSREGIFDPRSKNKLIAFMTLLQHLGFAMYLREKLSIVQRKTDLG